MKIFWSAFTLLLVLNGCSASKVSGNLKGAKQAELKVIAQLPIDQQSDISRERSQLIARLIGEELQGAGYILIDDQIVERVCKDAKREARSTLASKYGAQGFAEVKLATVSRANFVLGHVNAISGSIALLDSKGQRLVEVSRTERERGGLLFNTGQLAQAVISIAENSRGDKGFSKLAVLFANALVSELPRASSADAFAITDTREEIYSVNFQSEARGFESVCIRGTPAGSAALVINKLRTNLREVSSGKYCGSYRSSDLSSGAGVVVELRSPLGGLAKKELNLSVRKSCNLESATRLKAENNRAVIEIECEKSALPAQFLVYKTASELGPFQKIAAFMGSRWSAPIKSIDHKNFILVVGVDKKGEWLTPGNLLALNNAGGAQK